MIFAAWPDNGSVSRRQETRHNLRYNPPKSFRTPDALTDGMAVVADCAMNKVMGPPASENGNWGERVDHVNAVHHGGGVGRSVG